MPNGQAGRRRLDDLLIEPRENLETELKGWLDIETSQDHRATLAKALIALANHGGGYVIIGMEQGETSAVEAGGRPASLSSYNPDTVNAVVARYAEPTFHCDVVTGTAPNGALFPIISVPGGHSVPIRAKRDGPSRQILQNTYYIRRPGPQSEAPATGQEWDQLIRRCLGNAREELLDQFRAILAGVPATEPGPSDEQRLLAWIAECDTRWHHLVLALPQDSGARLPHGRWMVGYQLNGNLDRIGLADLRERMRQGTIPHTGWPAFWVPTRAGIAPYIEDDALECWLGADESGPAHADFWRANTSGQFFLVRGYQEDEAQDRGFAPGTAFDVTLPAWRLGEVLLHAENMARLLGDPSAEVAMQVTWSGLSGRGVVSLSGQRAAFGDYKAHQDVFQSWLSVRADQISTILPELVAQVVRQLYERFDFMRLPDNLVPTELAKMRSNRF